MVHNTEPRRTSGVVEADARRPRPLRLQRRDPILGSDHVNGGWWPYSRVLEDELPTLIEALASSGFAVHRVMYSLRGWDDKPRALATSGRAVRLTGYYTQQSATLILTDSSGLRPLILLVVPPELAADAAAQALTEAGSDGDDHRIVEILERAIAGVRTPVDVP